jgi:ABC-type multidrug transport system fused ATPase/permease subunit
LRPLHERLLATLKAMAVEPHMQRRWEEQLARYVHASFRTQTLANFGSQAVQFVNNATILLTLYFRAEAVIAGEMTVGELVAFNMLAARVAQPVTARLLSNFPDLGRFSPETEVRNLSSWCPAQKSGSPAFDCASREPEESLAVGLIAQPSGRRSISGYSRSAEILAGDWLDTTCLQGVNSANS